MMGGKYVILLNRDGAQIMKKERKEEGRGGVEMKGEKERERERERERDREKIGGYLCMHLGLG